MNKLTKEKVIFIVGLIMFISIITLVSMLYTAKNEPRVTIIPNNDNEKQTTVTTSSNTAGWSHPENFDKYKCEYTSTVDWTECNIEALDRASAEREWKQHKLETIKNFDISVDYMNMLPDISTEQMKISKWREGFESFRDMWCEAGATFASGSGTPGSIANCKLGLEKKAIEDLNSIYYWTIKEVVGDSKAVSGFEPSDADINLLVKTNKTNRGCVWLGEDKCDK